MGYDYYCLLCLNQGESKLFKAELIALRTRYLALKIAERFPELGTVHHTGSGGLGSGINDWARDGLRDLSAVLPARVFIFWCVYWDLTAVAYVQVQDGRILDEKIIAGDDDPPKGPFGLTMIPQYHLGYFDARKDISGWLEDRYDFRDPGSGFEDSSESD